MNQDTPDDPTPAPHPTFEVDVVLEDTDRRTGPGVTARLTGALDGVAAGALRAVLDQLRRAGFRQVAVDLAGLSSVGAAGVEVLARCVGDYAAEGCVLTLTPSFPVTGRGLGLNGVVPARAVASRAVTPAARIHRPRSTALCPSPTRHSPGIRPRRRHP